LEDLELKKKEDGSWKLKLPEGEVANLEQGALAGLARMEVFGLPIGKAAGSILTVMLWDMLRGMISGAIPTAIPQWAIPAIGSWVMTTKTVGGIVGSEIADAAGLILLVDAIQASPLSPRKLLSGVFKGQQLPETERETAEREATISDVADWLKTQ